jgi:hypothetical protein
MQNSCFTVLEHQLAKALGLSSSEIVNRRKQLTEGTDFVRIGRWYKWAPHAVEALKSSLQVPEIPPPPPDEWVDAVVYRCNFVNKRVIECKLTEGNVVVTRISPLWHHLYAPKMPLKIKGDGDRAYTTRRPRKKGRF